MARRKGQKIVPWHHNCVVGVFTLVHGPVCCELEKDTVGIFMVMFLVSRVV